MIKKAEKIIKKAPDLRPGDVVRVHVKIKEGGKERQQIFEGVIIKRQGGTSNAASILVRKISEGIGVERKFMLASPFIAKIDVKKRSMVKRADLSYLRNIKQVHRHLKDKKVAPFEAMLVEEVIKAENKETQEEKTEAKKQETKDQKEKISEEKPEPKEIAENKEKEIKEKIK